MLEVYSGGDGARFFEGEVEVSVQGIWIFDNPDGWEGETVTAIQRHNENSSSLSAPRPVPGRSTATPTPTATGQVPDRHLIFLPWSERR
jgi:hypothetical protein